MMNNPQQNMMQQILNSNNPLFIRAQQMADGKTPEEIQQIAMNLCKERGFDFQTMLQQFKTFQSQFKF